MTGQWRKLHNWELHNLYSSKSLRMIKKETGRLRNTHGRGEKLVQNCLQRLKGWQQTEDIHVGGKIILNWILSEQGGRCGLWAVQNGSLVITLWFWLAHFLSIHPISLPLLHLPASISSSILPTLVQGWYGMRHKAVSCDFESATLKC